MGCDIHMVVERRWRDRWIGLHAFPYMTGGIWFHELGLDYNSEDGKRVHAQLEAGVSVKWPARDRNYELFAALAGVRGDGPKARGLPDDMSDLARAEWESWGGLGDHSFTWYSMREAMPIFLRHQFNGVKRLMNEVNRDGSPVTQEQLSYRCMEYFCEHYPSPEDEDNTLDAYRLLIGFDS
jgi:hypothetical protein